jgi:hypothetical protein
MMVVGALVFLQGLIALVRGDYYSFDASEILVVNLRTWGWILVFWGAVVALTGLGLLLLPNVRWFAVGVVVFAVIGELSFAGTNHYPLWGLVGIVLSVLVLYALIVRWSGAEENATD